MKTNKIIGIFIFLTFLFISCNRNDSMNELQFEKFKKDKNFDLLLSYTINKASKNNSTVSRINESVLLEACLDLSEVYGEVAVLEYIDQLSVSNTDYVQTVMNASSGSSNDGDKCHRNSDGTVHMSSCTFWKTVKAIFSAAINCGPGEPTEWYYNCVQESVCRNC